MHRPLVYSRSMLAAHHSLELLYTTLGWISNIALVVYAPFARSWRRALLVQCLLVGAWAAVRYIATSNLGEDSAPASFYLIVLTETLVFAVATRTLKILLFKLPAFKTLEAHLRPQRR